MFSIFLLKRLRREWPRWWSRKTLRPPPLMNTPKSQLYAEKTWMKKIGIYQKRSPTTKDQEGNKRWVGQVDSTI